MAINLNVSPYYDDYDPRANYYRILFRPRFPVQARELTQMQTMQQEQIKRFGDHVFENKSLVIPGEIKYDNRYDWIKIDQSNSANNSFELDTFWLNKTILGATGTRALVVGYLEPNVDGETVLYIKYLAGGNSGENSKFEPGEALTNEENALAPSVLLTSPNPEGVLGVGSAAHINDGVYYINGFFVLVESQTVILSPFSTTPTARVGLKVNESLVTPEDDESIKDNALGFPSYAAPGAHRLKIELELISKDLNLNLPTDPEDEKDFIELLRLQNGIILSKVDRSDYAILERTLARRTYDESGDYTVRDFKLEVREFYRENGNNGIYEDKDFFYDDSADAEAVAESRFGITGWHFDPGASGKAMPGDTHQEFQDAARALLVLGIDPGKAYVQGYEIETISKRLLDYPKARTFQHSSSITVDSQVGNYVLVRDLNGIPNITTYPLVNLYDNIITTPGTPSGTLIGTARVRGIEYDSGPIAVDMSDAIFKLHLFDIQVDESTSFEQVKSIHMDRAPGGNGPEDFTCNINLEEFRLDGTVTQDGSGNLTGVGTFFQSRQTQALRPNDFIVIDDGGTKKYRRIVAVSTDSTATVTPGAGGDAIATASNFFYVYAELKEVDKNVLIFPLSNAPVKSIRDEANDIKTQIVTRREFSVVVGGGNVTLNLTDTSEDFVQFDQDDYVFAKELGPGSDPIGRVYNYNQISVVSQTFSDDILAIPAQIVFTHPDFDNGDTIRVIATIRKKGNFASQEKQKILEPNEEVITGSGVSNLQTVSLGKADIYKINAIYMSADFTTVPTSGDLDITNRYDLDNGQRDNIYDIGSIILKPNTPAPTGRILIDFDYFSHSNANKNYFSVDSYPIPYADIPDYVSVEDGLTYELRNCLDFRPRINDAGTNFDVVTGSLSEPPVQNILVDYSYYLNRIDKLYLDSKANFLIAQGIPAVDPVQPDSVENTMLLYTLETRAYTFKPKDVFQTKIDNRRFTMRDIGALQNRIERLEYYTALTLLEKETADLSIRDSDGLERFKNGFIVDSFEGHGVGDVLNPDYRCSVDMVQKEMRPSFSEDNFRLQVEELTNCEQYGDLLMLERSADSIFIQQPLASRFMNVNPYAVFTFIGSMVLTPENDEWKDVSTLPDLVVNVEGNYSQIEAQAEATGTVWGEWQTNWSGVPQQTKEVISRQIRPGPNPPDAHHKTGWPKKRTTVIRTTTTLDGTQTRSGVRATVIPEIVTEHLGERVIDVSYIPFMRTRDVTFVVKGLKPTTRMYAFFDQIDVSAYVTANSSTYNPANNILTGTPLVSDATGKCEGVFRIPGAARAGFLDTPQGLQFRTGERMFRLSDSPNNGRTFNTAAETPYRAQGLLETRQSTILSIRNARLGQEIVSDSESIQQSSFSDETRVKWIDPLAQSFLVTERGGLYISKVGLFFRSKDENIPVTVQLREMVNGYPGQRILPFGEITLDAIDVNITEDETAPKTETIFEFPSPVFIPEGTEACFVVLSNSNNYNVYVGRLGENVLGTDIPIQEQPYAGVLFKSQNASTWSADQETDMMFNLYKAQWSTNQTGTIILTNDEDDVAFTRLLQPNALEFVDGSARVRIHHPNHGMPSITSVQSRVQITGIQQTSATPSPNIAGIPLTELEGVTLVVEDVTTDSYVVEVTTPADTTTFAGGSQMIATQNLQMDAMYSIIGSFVLPGTGINYGIRTTSGRGPFQAESVEPYKVQSSYIDHTPNETVIFTNQRLVGSALNESNLVIPGGSKTFFMLASLRTSNPNISPCIDAGRMSVVTIANRIDDSNVDNLNIAPFDTIELVTANTNIDFVAATNSIEVDSDSGTIEALRQILPGRYITIAGGTLDPANVGTFRVTDVEFVPSGSPQLKIFLDAELANDTGEATTVTLLRRFIDERAASAGSALAKYITRRFVLAQPSIGIKVMAAIDKPAGCNVDLYYKISKVDDPTPFDEVPYTLADWDSPLVDSVNDLDIRDATATIDNLPDFSIVSVKLVLRGTNTAIVPAVKDLRVIALGT